MPRLSKLEKDLIKELGDDIILDIKIKVQLFGKKKAWEKVIEIHNKVKKIERFGLKFNNQKLIDILVSEFYSTFTEGAIEYMENIHEIEKMEEEQKIDHVNSCCCVTKPNK